MSREDDHVLRRALEFEVGNQRKKAKKDIEEASSGRKHEGRYEGQGHGRCI